MFDVRSDLKLAGKDVVIRGSSEMNLAPVKSKYVSNHPIMDQNTQDNATHESMDAPLDISKMEAIIEAELDQNNAKTRGHKAKVYSVDVNLNKKEGTVFPYEEELYQGGADDINMGDIGTMIAKDKDKDQKALKKRRPDIKNYIL